jgi:hypothetical protein
MRKTVQELIEEFSRNVLAQKRALSTGDWRTGNHHARRYIAAFDGIRRIGDSARDKFAELLDHPDPEVRLMSACYLLRYKTADSMKVLQELSERSDMTGFGAIQCMKRWEEGEWQLDPES